MIRFERAEFLDERFRYRHGEHLTVLGPTGSGKTTLLNQLADKVITPARPGIALAMKPRDSTMQRAARDLDLRTVRTWPPSWSLLNTARAKPRGFVLWPKHTFDPDVDDAHLYDQFRRCILDSYKRGNRLLLADELLGLGDLNLDRELIALWTRGRSMGVGLWGGTQKPTHIPLYAYNQAEHLLLAYDPDARARKRFAEIGGVDPVTVERAVYGLDKYEWLYIRRDGGRMCVVGP